MQVKRHIRMQYRMHWCCAYNGLSLSISTGVVVWRQYWVPKHSKKNVTMLSTARLCTESCALFECTLCHSLPQSLTHWTCSLCADAFHPRLRAFVSLALNVTQVLRYVIYETRNNTENIFECEQHWRTVRALAYQWHCLYGASPELLSTGIVE